MNGEYSFVGILPREKNIVDDINDLDAEKLMEDLKECEDPSTVELNVTMPKFKYNYSKSLKEILIDMGMGDAFNDKLADFSKINDLTVDGAQPLYIGDVLHKTKIELTEKGTKAAAVTAVMMVQATAFEPMKRKINIDLNRPFVYMIVDKNNVPVFIGAVTQLEEN
jgi:serine protease inhibitor